VANLALISSSFFSAQPISVRSCLESVISWGAKNRRIFSQLLSESAKRLGVCWWRFHDQLRIFLLIRFDFAPKPVKPFNRQRISENQNRGTSMRRRDFRMNKFFEFKFWFFWRVSSVFAITHWIGLGKERECFKVFFFDQLPKSRFSSDWTLSRNMKKFPKNFESQNRMSGRWQVTHAFYDTRYQRVKPFFPKL